MGIKFETLEESLPPKVIWGMHLVVCWCLTALLHEFVHIHLWFG